MSPYSTGKVALGKLSQATIHGATVLQIDGNFDQALSIVRHVVADDPSLALVNSINPYRIEGQKSGAYEICDCLGASPDFHFISVGNAGNITAYWKGYREYLMAGRIGSLPKMVGWQAEGAAPIVHGRVIEQPETIASAIRIGNPASWQGALAAAKESNGSIGPPCGSDDAIIEAYRLLASAEGVFCELASAASVAGLIKYTKTNRLPEGAVVVCVLTGHGLKDPNSAVSLSSEPVTVKADPDAVRRFLLS